MPSGTEKQQKISNDFEPVTIERIQPRHNGVVTRCSVGIVASLPNRVLVDAGQDDDAPDVAGLRGLPLTPGNGSEVMTSSATSFTSDAERYSSRFGMVNTSKSGHFSWSTQ